MCLLSALPMCQKVGTVVKLQAGRLTFFKVRCRSWLCPECSHFRRKRLIADCQAGQPNRFVTLTVNPHWFDSPEERAKRLSAAWRKIVALYRRKWPNRELHYAAVFEETTRGEPHLHLMLRSGWLDQKWLSAQMEKEMGAPIVDVRWVRSQKQVVSYIHKYISKRSIKFGNCKRYWYSAHYLPKKGAANDNRPQEPYYVWVSKRHILEHLAACVAAGITCDYHPDGRVTADLPPRFHHPPWLWLDDAAWVDPAAKQKQAA